MIPIIQVEFILFGRIYFYSLYIIGFINIEEFAQIIKLLLSDDYDDGNLSQEYIDELCSAMDIDGNGRIDANEFLGKIRLRALFTTSWYFREVEAKILPVF